VSAVISPAPSTTAPPEVRSGIRLSRRPSDWLLPASIVLWAVGVSRTDVSHLGPYGLVSALPIVFYLGLGLLVVSAALELGRQTPSRVRMALHAVALVSMLYGTAPLVYPEGRYSWLYKTIGVVQYVNAHGQLDRNIDIYQNWPGFFAFTAWFDKVAGVGSPLVYAKWAQLVAELAALPLLHMAYTALSLPIRQRWLAILIYSASNWIGQDYFSPQAFGTLLSLGVIAIALRWAFAGNSAGSTRWLRPDHDRGDRHRYWANWRLKRAAPFVLTLILIFGVLTFSHELTPYVVVIQLGCLAAAGLVRPRWVPLVLTVVAVGYFLPRLSFVNSHFGLLASFGKFFSNAAPPSATAAAAGPPVPPSQRVIQDCSAALSLGIWMLALLGAWLRRRSRRTVLALFVLAYSPIVVLGIGAYGNEGILRVYLFSLPWAAALVAAALVPLPGLNPDAKSALWYRLSRLRAALRRNPGHVAETGTFTNGTAATVARLVLAMAVSLTLFFPAFFGDDASNTVSQPEVDTITTFLQTAPPGIVFVPTNGAPLADTSRYNLFNVALIFGPGTVVDKPLPTADVANLIARTAQRFTRGLAPAYVVVTPSMMQYNDTHPIVDSAAFRILLVSLARSSEWVALTKSHGVYIYELPPGSQILAPQGGLSGSVNLGKRQTGSA
jgi:hypothetical protein